MADSLVAFFKDGGIFLFDEGDPASEATFYKLEDLMGEPEGADITELSLDEEGTLSIYYDGSVMDEETAKQKYGKGLFVKSI